MSRIEKILILSDLDRTIIPNGRQAESALARPLLHRLAACPEIVLVYISGRGLSLVRAAVAEYDLPYPAWAVCDVGTAVYRRDGERWREMVEWSDGLRADFRPDFRESLARALAPCPALVLQEERKQTPYKLSYYWDSNKGSPGAEVVARIGNFTALVNVVLSVDETTNRGLLDILPLNADKLHAARFILRLSGVGLRRTVFAGDSGNDLPVLASEIPAVLVANATDEVRREATARAAGHAELLYLARGGFMGMNGNYAAGLIEGLVHFIPETAAILDRENQ